MAPSAQMSTLLPALRDAALQQRDARAGHAPREREHLRAAARDAVELAGFGAVEEGRIDFVDIGASDGITWSNISMANDDRTHSQGAFNLSRPYIDAAGQLKNVSYYTARPKLLLSADGTPTHLYGSAAQPAGKGSFTVAEPLGGGS